MPESGFSLTLIFLLFDSYFLWFAIFYTVLILENKGQKKPASSFYREIKVKKIHILVYFTHCLSPIFDFEISVNPLVLVLNVLR